MYCRTKNIFVTHNTKKVLKFLMEEKEPFRKKDVILSASSRKEQYFLSESLVALFGLTRLKHHSSFRKF